MKKIQYYFVNSYISYPVGFSIIANIKSIKEMAFKLKKVFYGYELNLWCRGSSGAIMAGIVASIIPNTIISYVRKDGEASHSESPYATDGHRKNIVIDDLVASGRTISIIKNFMFDNHVKVDCLCVGGSLWLSEELEDYAPIMMCQHLSCYGKSYNFDSVIELQEKTIEEDNDSMEEILAILNEEANIAL